MKWSALCTLPNSAVPDNFRWSTSCDTGFALKEVDKVAPTREWGTWVARGTEGCRDAVGEVDCAPSAVADAMDISFGVDFACPIPPTLGASSGFKPQSDDNLWQARAHFSSHTLLRQRSPRFTLAALKKDDRCPQNSTSISPLQHVYLRKSRRAWFPQINVVTFS